MTGLPGPDATYRIPRGVLTATRDLLTECGRRGHEAAVVWLGDTDSPDAATVRDVYRPAQIATATPFGLSVEITEDGLTTLIAGLVPPTVVLARLHTHGDTDTCHSELDDTNFLVGHIGAISIVVPSFARAPLNLRNCAVHQLAADGTWSELSPADIDHRFHVHD